MELKIIKIKDIKTADWNPRKISKSEMEKLKRSIKEFGIVRPLVINKRDGILISGHQTVKACEVLGMEELPYIEVDVDESKEKILATALNKIGGTWDDDKLKELLDSISKSTEDLILTGFDNNEIEQLLSSNADKILINDTTKREISIRERKNINSLIELSGEIERIVSDFQKDIDNKEFFLIKLHSLILFLNRVERKFTKIKEKEGGQEKEKEE